MGTGVRLEENIYTRLEKTKPHRSETEELLGAEMGKASSAFGDDTSEYGESVEREITFPQSTSSFDMHLHNISHHPIIIIILIGRGLPPAVWISGGQDGAGTAGLPQSSAERVSHSSQGFPGGGR